MFVTSPIFGRVPVTVVSAAGQLIRRPDSDHPTTKHSVSVHATPMLASDVRASAPALVLVIVPS